MADTGCESAPSSGEIRELTLLADTSGRFVSLPSIEIGETIRQALSETGEHAKVDSAYVFLFRDDLETATCVTQWVRKHFAQTNGRLHSLPFVSTPWWLGKMNRHEVCQLPSLDHIPEDAGHYRRQLDSLGIVSSLDMPLVQAGQLIGFIRWASLAHQVDWSEEKVSILRIVAEMIGRALARQNYENQLEDARKAAEAASEVKSQFLANMSHEIRTPLSGIIGMTDILLDTDLSTNQKRDRL